MFISIMGIYEGMKLSNDVHSKLGGILFKKGTVLDQSAIEILKAFDVKKIEIEDTEKKTIKKEKKDNDISNKSYHPSFNEFKNNVSQAIKEADKLFKIAQGNAPIPIFELRKAIQPLLSDEYQKLKYFTTLSYNHDDFIKYNSYHAISVGIISSALAKWYGLNQAERMQIALAGALHDIGIIRIPNNITTIKGALSVEEYDEVKKHTLYGYQILKETRGINDGVLLAVLQHHERIDGSGYPFQLKNEKIHLYAKIIAVADVFHAMISKRSYREEYSPYKAIDLIMYDSFGKLDPILVRLFTNNMTKYTNGTKVILSNGHEGFIVFVDSKHPTRPWVKVGDSIINLEKEKELFIKEVI